MSIFTNLLEGIGLKSPSYGRMTTEIPKFNAQPAMDRMKALELRVDQPIGITGAGDAALSSANKSFEEQTQRSQEQSQSNRASSVAQQSMFGGISSGSMERGDRTAQQEEGKLAQAQAGEQSRASSDIISGDLRQEQDFKNTGLMNLPGMHQNLESAKVGANQQAAGMEMKKEGINNEMAIRERAAQKRNLGAFGSTLFGKKGAGLSMFA